MITSFPIFNSYENIVKNRILAKKRGGLILLYHRVADVKEDPHLLCVSKENFEKQIEWLRNNFEVVSLSELAVLAKNHKLNNNLVCVTFDDGYKDNYVNAFPVLKKYKVPATIFVTSGYINTEKPFYWNKKTTKISESGLPMTLNQIRELSKSGLIEIGSHTVTHPHLSKVTHRKQWNEINESRNILEIYLKKEVKSFSYPFGTFWDIDKESIKMAEKAGYKIACGNFPGKVFNNTNNYLLPRLIVRNWTLQKFADEIKFWE